MITVLAGFCVAFLLWWGLKAFARASPARVARIVRQVGAGLAFLMAAILMVRGRFDMAFLLGSGGAWLLGWAALPAPFGGRAAASAPKRAGGRSTVRSALVEMQLDHDTGELQGRVYAGRQAGRDLSGLDRTELLGLFEECRRVDPDGVRLLEAYLDRRLPGWREDAEPDPDRGRRGEPERGAMSEQEAHEILGLQPGAGPEEVRDAHRRLMKALHPDSGGSTYLASRVNQAKDVLLNRHR